ncbi:MAG: ATP-binding protein [Dehalococcoidia bacterium]
MFEDFEAVRTQVLLWLGLVGPSGCGKTYSALELATGMQEVSGGDIHLLDTENGRGRFYADRFKFRHVPFSPPFGPADYRAAFAHSIKKGAKIIIADSFSHEHDGPGGVLQMHDAEVTRRGGDKHSFAAWAAAKAPRKDLITFMMQSDVNYILCFRAKEKIKLDASKKPISLGWQPIAGQDYIYELALNCLLLPGCKGVPIWNPNDLIPAERQMVKLPEQFTELFADGPQLSRQVGAALATWASGGQASRQALPPEVAAIIARYAECDDAKSLADIKATMLPAAWKIANKQARAAITAAGTAATDRVRAAVADRAAADEGTPFDS